MLQYSMVFVSLASLVLVSMGILDDDIYMLLVCSLCSMRVMCVEAWSSNAAIWSLSQSRSSDLVLIFPVTMLHLSSFLSSSQSHGYLTQMDS